MVRSNLRAQRTSSYLGAGIIAPGGGEVVPALPTVDVLFIAGQSNAATIIQNGDVIPSALQGEMSNVFIWQPWNDQFGVYQAGVNSDTLFSDPPVTASARSGSKNFSAEAEFARRWKMTNPTRPLYIVKVAKGSSALQEGARDGTIAIWDPSKSNEMWATFKAARDKAMAALAALGKSANVLGMMWMQGESDSRQTATANNYGNALSAFIDKCRSDIMGGSSAPFIIGRISQVANWTYSAAVRAAQVDLGTNKANCRWFDTDGYGFGSDGVHYSAASAQTMGRDLWFTLFAPASYDAASQALFAAAANTPSLRRKQDIDWTMRRLIAEGIRGKGRGVYLIGADEQVSRINWVSPGTSDLTKVGTPTFTANDSWKANASGDRLTTGILASVLTDADYTFGALSKTAGTSDASDLGAIGSGGSGVSATMKSAATGQPYLRAGSTVTAIGTAADFDGAGLLCITRRDSANAMVHLRGALKGTLSIAGVALPAVDFSFLGLNNNGTFGSPSIRKQAAGYVGAALSDTQHASLAAIIDEYLTAISASG